MGLKMKRINRKQLFDRIVEAHKLQNAGWALVAMLQHEDWPVGQTAQQAFRQIGDSGLILAELLDELGARDE